MGNKNHNLPGRLVKGGVKRSQEAKVPGATGRGGRIQTDLNINWTRKRAFLAGAILGVPFLLATVVAFKSGNILVGCILTFIAVFVGLLYLALRYIENNEF